ETGIRSPLDTAILQQHQPDTQAARKLDEIPFDFERRRLSVVVETGVACLLITKGAPEPLLALCEAYEVDGVRTDFDDAARRRCETTYETLSAQGYRVLPGDLRPGPRQAAHTANHQQH